MHRSTITVTTFIASLIALSVPACDGVDDGSIPESVLLAESDDESLAAAPEEEEEEEARVEGEVLADAPEEGDEAPAEGMIPEEVLDLENMMSPAEIVGNPQLDGLFRGLDLRPASKVYIKQNSGHDAQWQASNFSMVEFWIYPRSIASQPLGYYTFRGQGERSSLTFFTDATGKICAYLDGADNNFSSTFVSAKICSTSALPVSRWSHVALKITSATVNGVIYPRVLFYIDGVSRSPTFSASAYPTWQKWSVIDALLEWELGHISGSVGGMSFPSYVNGIVDEFRLWAAADNSLTPSLGVVSNSAANLHVRHVFTKHTDASVVPNLATLKNPNGTKSNSSVWLGIVDPTSTQAAPFFVKYNNPASPTPQ